MEKEPSDLGYGHYSSSDDDSDVYRFEDESSLSPFEIEDGTSPSPHETAVQMLITSTRRYKVRGHQTQDANQVSVSHAHDNRSRTEWIREICICMEPCRCCRRFVALEMTIRTPDIHSRLFSRTDTQLAIAIHGFRVVETFLGLSHLEFKVFISSSSCTYEAWRSYEDFRRLAANANVFNHALMKRAAFKFELLRAHRGWIQSTTLTRMVGQFRAAGDFMGELLFAIECPSILVGFADDARWHPKTSVPCECGHSRVNRGNFFRNIRYCGAEALEQQYGEALEQQ